MSLQCQCVYVCLAWVAGGLPEILFGKDDFVWEYVAASLASLLTTNIDQTCAEREAVKYFQQNSIQNLWIVIKDSSRSHKPLD